MIKNNISIIFIYKLIIFMSLYDMFIGKVIVDQTGYKEHCMRYLLENLSIIIQFQTVHVQIT